jgi:hypothetical protein
MSIGYCLILGQRFRSGLNARAIRNHFGRRSPFGGSNDLLLILSVRQIPLCQAIIVVAKEWVRCVFGQLKKFGRVTSIALRCAQEIGHSTLPLQSGNLASSLCKRLTACSPPIGSCVNHSRGTNIRSPVFQDEPLLPLDGATASLASGARLGGDVVRDEGPSPRHLLDAGGLGPTRGSEPWKETDPARDF